MIFQVGAGELCDKNAYCFFNATTNRLDLKNKLRNTVFNILSFIRHRCECHLGYIGDGKKGNCTDTCEIMSCRNQVGVNISFSKWFD